MLSEIEPDHDLNRIAVIISMKEFLYYKPDVACLQEVDKVDVHGPILQNAGYDFFHTTGYAAKLHGLCIVWRKNAFDMIQHRTVKLDSAPLGSSPAKTGCSRVTRNIGLFVALKYREGTHPDGSPDGIILVTREPQMSKLQGGSHSHPRPSACTKYWRTTAH